MYSYLNDYSYIALDFSVVFAPSDRELVQALSRHPRVCVAPTFFCECGEVMETFPASQRKIFRKNLELLRPVLTPADERYGAADTFGMLRNAFQSHAADKILVMERNRTLEDKIIFRNLPCDLCDTRNPRERITYAQFPDEREKRELRVKRQSLDFCPVRPGSPVYASDGKTYVLAHDNSYEGAESVVYRLEDAPGLAAKIFKPTDGHPFSLTEGKLGNIKSLIAERQKGNPPWLALPEEVLYAVSGGKLPVGYSMPYLPNVTWFFNDIQYCGNIEAILKNYPDLCVRDILQVCVRFVRQALFLSLRDIHITDFNDKNFGVSPDFPEQIVMVDTDSYGHDAYAGEYPTYLGDLRRELNYREKRLDLLELCDESLILFILTRLTLDDSFRPLSTGFDFPNEGLRAKWEAVPENLKIYFEAIFQGIREPSMGVLLYELRFALDNASSARKYRELFTTIAIPDGAPPVARQGKNARLDSSTDNPSGKRKILRYILPFSALFCAFCALFLLFLHLRATEPETREIRWVQYPVENGYFEFPDTVGPSLTGTGKYYADNGNWYEGEFVDGKRTGEGEYHWANGEWYRGEFVDGKRTGEGEYHWTNEEWYRGEFADDVRTGWGEYHWPNENRYKGEFLNGKRTGAGEYFFANGDWYKGTFLDGRYSGQGEMHWANGDWYRGDFEDDQPTGVGEIHFANGDWYKGEFLDGRYSGQGRLKQGDKVYEGIFMDGKPYGEFTLYRITETGEESLLENGYIRYSDGAPKFVY